MRKGHIFKIFSVIFYIKIIMVLIRIKNKVESKKMKLKKEMIKGIVFKTGSD